VVGQRKLFCWITDKKKGGERKAPKAQVEPLTQTRKREKKKGKGMVFIWGSRV